MHPRLGALVAACQLFLTSAKLNMAASRLGRNDLVKVVRGAKDDIDDT
jgi:hypothetical protein